MALPLSGYKDYQLLVIKTKELTLTIKGKPVHPTVDRLNLHRDESGEWVKVLVGVVRNKEQLKVNLDKGFYHIPYDLVRKGFFNVDYVALYQPGNTFGDDSGIRYYGPVYDTEVLKRKDIREIPSESEKLYVRFRIREWQKRREPIKPAGYGVRTHIYTTLYLLMQAEELPELSLTSERETRLWKELRRLGKSIRWKASNRQLTNQSKVQEVEFDQVSLRVENEELTITNGEQEEKIPVTILESKPRTVLKAVLRLLGNPVL